MTDVRLRGRLVVGGLVLAAAAGGVTTTPPPPPRATPVPPALPAHRHHLGATLIVGSQCTVGNVFAPIVPGTKDGVVTRVRGTAPTEFAVGLAAGYDLSGLRVEVAHGGRAVQTHALPPTRGQDQPVTVRIGDLRDDGEPLAPGRYEVRGAATYNGRDSCGRPDGGSVVMTLGFLVLR
jgi:hypothetical protein